MHSTRLHEPTRGAMVSRMKEIELGELEQRILFYIVRRDGHQVTRGDLARHLGRCLADDRIKALDTLQEHEMIKYSRLVRKSGGHSHGRYTATKRGIETWESAPGSAT